MVHKMGETKNSDGDTAFCRTILLFREELAGNLGDSQRFPDVGKHRKCPNHTWVMCVYHVCHRDRGKQPLSATAIAEAET